MASKDMGLNELLRIGGAELEGPTGATTRLNFGVIAEADSIDGTVATTTALLTVPAGALGIPMFVVIFMDSDTGLTGTLQAGVGTNAGADDIMPSTVLTGFNTAGTTFLFPISGVMIPAAPASVINFGIDTAFGGTDVELSVVVLGLIPNS